MVSALVFPSIAVMSMPRAPTTRSRTWSPSAQSKRRASSADRVTELRCLLVGIGLVGHRPAADLGTGQVLQQPRRAERRMQLDVERIVRVISDRSLMDC